jgi:hypothetical protein
MFKRKEAMTSKNTFQTVVPASAAEAAVAEVTWERRGILGRLVRIDDAVTEERRSAPRAASPARAL